MSVSELKKMGIELSRAPSGTWFVSWSGWGRPVGNYEDAYQYAITLAKNNRKQP